jgi:hypothetical protein
MVGTGGTKILTVATLRPRRSSRKAFTQNGNQHIIARRNSR